MELMDVEFEKIDCPGDPNGWENIKKHIPDPMCKTHIWEAEQIMEGYIFKHREGKKYIGYCTKCKKDVPAKKEWMHGEDVRCPRCRKLVKVRDAWRGHSRLRETIYLVYYRRSKIQKDAVIAVGALFSRDYSGDYRSIKTDYEIKDYFLFTNKGGKKYTRIFEYESCKGWINIIRRRKKVTQTVFTNGIGYYTVISYESVRSMRIALKYAGLNHCMAEQICKITEGDRIGCCEVLDFCLRYPCVEYLFKMGQHLIICEKLVDKIGMRGIVNWNGKTAQQVLHLTGNQISEIKKQNIELSFGMLSMLRFMEKLGGTVSMKEAEVLSNLHWRSDDIQDIAKKMSLDSLAIIKYILKQTKYGRTASLIYGDLTDYWEQCKQLKMNLKDYKILFPKNIHERHQELTRRISYKKDKALNEKITERLLNLKKMYSFSFGGLLMRPAESSAELINEGNALVHCVGGYARNYAYGNTDICFIRRVDFPDKPFHTVEFRDGKLIQCRGYRNQTEEADRPIIDAFLKAFNEHIQTKTRRKAV